MRREAGFTLIELMVTVTVVVIALVGFVAANMAIQARSETVFERSVAIQDAHRVLEQMRDAANRAASEQFQGDVINAANAAVTTVASLPAADNEQITVTYADQAADPLEVTVSVAWNERGTRQTATSLRTYITPRSS